MTSIPLNGGESYPGHDFSISQLLYATKRKLLCSVFGGGISTSMDQIQVDALERDALEVLGSVRSLKNNLAPISKIPSDVFSLIPGYFGDEDEDET